MSAIVTVNMRVHAAKQFLSGFSDPDQHHYLFIGRTLPWNVDSVPPTPIDCDAEKSAAFRDMMSLKRIGSTDVCLVIPRNNWLLGTTYTQYAHDIDLFDPTSNLPPFYVITDSLNVYKCLNNNNGVPSTIQPTGTQTNVVTLADGYQWKYMFTVSSSDVLRFVTSEWLPVRTLEENDGSNQWLVQQSAIPGTIDRIDMITAGTQYTQVPTVVITGDGTGATAVALLSTGNVVGIRVTNTGSGYTWANVDIEGGGVAANGATAKAIISPFYGHGADPVTELGGFYGLVNSKLIFDENETFTVSNDFRRIGIVKNPILNDGHTFAVELDYTQAYRLTFNSVSGTTFVADETVTGNTSGATGVVMDYDDTNKVLRVVEVSGDFVPGETVVGGAATGVLQTFQGQLVSGTSSSVVLPNTASGSNDVYTGQMILLTGGTGSGQMSKITTYVGITRTASVSPVFSPAPDNTTTFVIASIVPPDLMRYQGDILYIENRRPIARAGDQQEDLKIVIEL